MGVALLRSTSILPTFTLPSYSRASSSTMGAMARHGPHQAAQKSTKTGVSDFRTSWSKFESFTSIMPLPAMGLLEFAAASAAACSGVQRHLQPTDYPNIFIGCWKARKVASFGIQLLAFDRWQLAPGSWQLIRWQVKRRPEPLVSGRLGSPPPELPNHAWIVARSPIRVNVTLVIRKVCAVIKLESPE